MTAPAQPDRVEVVAYLHVMHMEGGQTNERLTFSPVNPFGVAGQDYDEDYPVTSAELCFATAEASAAEIKRLEKDRNVQTSLVETYRLSALAQHRARVAAEAKIARLREERDEARKIVRDTHWMARRYADGRRSYAVGMFNDAIRPAYEAGWVAPLDNGEPAYARDGDFDAEYVSLADRLSAAEAENARLREALESQRWQVINLYKELRRCEVTSVVAFMLEKLGNMRSELNAALADVPSPEVERG